MDLDSLRSSHRCKDHNPSELQSELNSLYYQSLQ